MTVRKAGFTRNCGMTLIEVVVATTIVGLVASGALSYDYHGARQIRIGRAYAGATRIAGVVLEDWKANAGSVQYARSNATVSNPEKLKMGFVYTGDGIYRITVDGIPMQVELSRPDSYLKLIPLTVTVRWRNDFVNNNMDKFDPSVALTTYSRIDQASG